MHGLDGYLRRSRNLFCFWLVVRGGAVAKIQSRPNLCNFVIIHKEVGVCWLGERQAGRQATAEAEKQEDKTTLN